MPSSGLGRIMANFGIKSSAPSAPHRCSAVRCTQYVYLKRRRADRGQAAPQIRAACATGISTDEATERMPVDIIGHSMRGATYCV